MAYDDFPSQAEVSQSGGGRIHFDPNDISAAKPIYNTETGTYEWRMPQYDSNTRRATWNNNSPLMKQPTNPNGFLRDDVNRTANDLYNGADDGGGGGGGGGIPAMLGKLAPLAGVLGGQALGGGGQTQMSPELQQLLAQALKRMSMQQPLFESINAQAMGGLPTAYQR